MTLNARPTSPAQPSTLQRARVLLAEDDILTNKLLTKLITQEGFTVVNVTDGRAAWHILQQDTTFALAVFDMQMPHFTGLELVQKMQAEESLKQIPTLIITAQGTTALHAQSLAAGTASFLHKPVAPDKFRALLHLLVDLGLRRMAS